MTNEIQNNETKTVAKKIKTATKKLPTNKTKTVEKTTNVLTIVAIAHELKMNPKVARAKLRRANRKSINGRHETFKRNSPEYKKIVALLTPAKTA